MKPFLTKPAFYAIPVALLAYFAPFILQSGNTPAFPEVPSGMVVVLIASALISLRAPNSWQNLAIAIVVSHLIAIVLLLAVRSEPDASMPGFWPLFTSSFLLIIQVIIGFWNGAVLKGAFSKVLAIGLAAFWFALLGDAILQTF